MPWKQSFPLWLHNPSDGAWESAQGERKGPGGPRKDLISHICDAATLICLSYCSQYTLPLCLWPLTVRWGAGSTGQCDSLQEWAAPCLVIAFWYPTPSSSFLRQRSIFGNRVCLSLKRARTLISTVGDLALQVPPLQSVCPAVQPAPPSLHPVTVPQA